MPTTEHDDTPEYLLKNRLDKRDLQSFRSDRWWNARLRGRDAIGWRVKHTTATQNQAKPSFADDAVRAV